MGVYFGNNVHITTPLFEKRLGACIDENYIKGACHPGRSEDLAICMECSLYLKFLEIGKISPKKK